MGHDHGHSHNHRGSSKRALRIVLGIVLTFFVVEAVGGYLTSSLALLADAGHLLSDVGALLLALFAFWIAERPANSQRTYGNLRVEVVAALASGVMLLAVAIFIGYEAFRRFSEPPEVLSLPMMLIAAAGLIGDTIGAFILQRSSHGNLNVRAAFIHVATDAVQSLGVVIAGALMLTRQWYLADPIISMVIAVLITWSGFRIARSSIHVLMEGTPPNVDADALRRDMESVEGVKDVHDLHIWTITSGFNALSAHVSVEEGLPQEEAQTVLSTLHSIASGRYGIEHVTVQLEEKPPEWPEGSHPSL